MRSYGQFCAAARALDLVGDRWSLLIVRELLLRDCRFTDLRGGLPGVATNLLTERLRQLEAAGVLERVDAPPPVASTLYRLTERGRALEPVLLELTRWGMPEMLRGADGDAARGHWAAGAVPLLYEGAALDDLAPLAVGLDVEGEQLVLQVESDGELHVTPGPARGVDVKLRGAMPDVMAALAGDSASLKELEVSGDRRRLRALTSRATLRP
jgi:DNA-binding HxlR family transcriptional regulator